MANLAEAVTADETDWIISADLDDDIDYLTVEDEIVHVTANFPAQYQAATGTTSVPRIRVERGAGGTTAATHADTTALTPLIPPSASGGAGGGITINLTGTATEPGNFFRGDEDPEVDFLAILEAGDVWIDTTGGVPYQQKIRNATNDGWLFLQLIAKDALGVELASISATQAGVSVAASTDGAPMGVVQVDVGGVISLNSGDANQSSVGLNPTGVISVDGADGVTLSSGLGTMGVSANGAIALSNTAGAGVTLAADGSVDIGSGGEIALSPDTVVRINGQIVGTQAAAIADLALAVSDPPTQAEVQDTANKVDALLAALRASGLLAP